MCIRIGKVDKVVDKYANVYYSVGMDDKIKCKCKETQMVRVATLSQEEKNSIKLAGRLSGLRQSVFYKRAILTYAQSVLSMSHNTSQNDGSTAKDNLAD